MNKVILLLFNYLQLIFCIVITISGPSNIFAQKLTTRLDVKTDSLKSAIHQCKTDTCRFYVLFNFFWKYGVTDITRVKHIGNWAYDEIKNSKNLKALSDGYDIKGCILEQEMKYDSAYPFFIKALAISQKIGYHSRTGWSYYHLGIINNALGRTDSALFYFKTLYLFDYSKKWLDDAFSVLKQIAIIYETNAQPDNALNYYNEMLKFSRQNKDKDKEIDAFLYFAYFHERKNNIKEELIYLNKALKLAESVSNNCAICQVYSNIGNLFLKQKKNYELSLSYYQKSLDKCDSKNTQFRAILLNILGALYLEMGNDSLASIYTLQSLKIAWEINHKHRISESHKSLGNIYLHQGRLKEAIDNFETCYNTGCVECPKIAFHSSLIKIADSYLKLYNPEKALEYYNESLTLAEKFKSNNELSISNLKLGNYYRSVNLNTAEKYYMIALQSARKSNDLAVLKTIADTLNSFFSKKQNYKEAWKYQAISNTMADSINNIEEQSSMADWELKFEFERINKENDEKEKLAIEEIKRQKIFRNSLLVCSILFISLVFLIYTSYKRKKRDYKILSEKNDEINEKNHEIQAQVEEIITQKNEIERISGVLHEADEMKLRFFSNISHEFRTPLTLIINPAENLLKTFPGNGENKKQLDHIYKNAHKLLDLTNQIMDLQKLEAGKLQLNPEKADIIEYCQGIVSSFESLCHKKNNTIKFTANHRIVIVSFDRDKIGKILINLMSNAFKFCYENSGIELNIEILESFLNLSVIDKGIGISNEQIDNVFRRFYQVPSGNQAAGTGIGLAYVKELTEFMNGTVSVDSIINEGTTIKVSIPVDEIEIKDGTGYMKVIPQTRKLQAVKEFDINEFINGNQNERSVLIVEDNEELRGFIAGLLKPDFNICLARDGQDGLQVAIRHSPDIIISDVMMPFMDGYELCTALKKDERTSHIPVILLTAMDSAQSSLEGYQTGADDYIIKPFDNELLKLKVKNMIATHEAARKQFDFKSILSTDGLKLEQTDKEFMRKCQAIIEKNIDYSGFSVDQLAEELAFSSRNFYRKIKALTNQTPAEFIRVYRLHYAKQLLQNSNLKVYEIAMAVGYDDIKSFRLAFKKQFGFKPSESLKNTIS